MNPALIKRSYILKAGLSLFLTIGCNLSIEGHFWPDNILPYIFLVLSGMAVSGIDLQEFYGWIRSYRAGAGAALFLVSCVLIQGVIMRIYLADSITVLIKAGIKVCISGTAAAVIVLSAFFMIYKKKKLPSVAFILMCLAGMLYFYIERPSEFLGIYPVIIFLLIYIVSVSTERKEGVPVRIGALIFAACEAFGYAALTYWAYNGSFPGWIAKQLIAVAVWTFIFYYVLGALFAMMDKAVDFQIRERKKLCRSRQYFLLAALVGVRCIYWLNWFPGLLSKDTYVQIKQALGTEAYSNHHPWLHTMIIKLSMGVGKLIFGSNQAGVAVTAFASLFFSSLLILVILRYYYSQINLNIWVLAALIYVIEPIHCVYSITIWKDVLFAYAMLAFCFMLMVMEAQIKETGKLRLYMWVLYVAVGFMFCFSRTNGLYAWLFTLPFILWHNRKNLRPWILSTLACLILIIGYKGFLLPHFQVTEPDTVEALSIPLQQIAFTIKNEGSFSEYDRDVIMNIVDMEAMGKNYNAHISDPVKNLIRDTGYQEYISENKAEFIRMYVSVGLKNPSDYIVAFLNQSRGYWYHKMSNYIYFSEGVHRFAAELGIYRTPLLPSGVSGLADRLMDKYCDIWHSAWSLALSTYVVGILFIYCLARRRTCFYLIPVIGVFLTLVIATPVNDEFRYAYGIYLALPMLAMQTALPDDKLFKHH